MDKLYCTGCGEVFSPDPDDDTNYLCPECREEEDLPGDGLGAYDRLWYNDMWEE